jgi:membrane-associated phospholipid phosphatase
MVTRAAVFAILDFKNLIFAIIGSAAYIALNLQGIPNARHLEIPPGEFDINYTKAASQTVTNSIQGLVIVGEAVFFIGVPRVFAIWFPNQIRRYRVLTAFWCYFFSLSLSGVTYSLFKGYVGRPRPDSLAKCEGNMENCAGTGSNSQFSSFPSGHAASTMACAVFLAKFLVEVTVKPTHLTTVIGFGIWMYTIYIGCSRIVDHRHHVDDVVGGWFIGAVLSGIAWEASRGQIYVSGEDEDEKNETGPGNSDPGIGLIDPEIGRK